MSGSRYVDKGLNCGKIKYHDVNIATAHRLASFEITVMVDHPMNDILDEVETMINISGRIPSDAEGLTDPSKLGDTIYSLLNHVIESVIYLKWENGNTSAAAIACGQNSSASKIFGLESDAARIPEIQNINMDIIR